MRAITVRPGVPNSARLDDIPEPPLSDGPVLVRTMALGVCGTDREIISGSYGNAPLGQQRLVLGHESLGEIKATPTEIGLAPGDLIVGIVRQPDPVPCPACVVFGTVNANRRHYKMAADALARADRAWLGRLLTRRVPLDRWSEALEYRHGDIKVVIDFVQ
jgi:threonine dehydrogenase-like Zn-dependent dehydrogenase